jgi:hypothetical protein
MKKIFIIFISLQALFAAPPRSYLTSEPPAIDVKPADSATRVVRRVYTRIDLNDSAAPEAKSARGAFAGLSVDLFRRDRKIEIKSKNNGDTIKVGSRYETANGATYKMSEEESQAAPNIEFGFLGGENFYYGAKIGLLDDFAEIAAFAGVKFNDAKIGGFSPFLQGAIGAGYVDLDDSLAPDNFSVTIGAGAQRPIVNDNLSVYLGVFYRYRFWRTLEKRYGDEYWRDNETGASVGVRYVFGL